MDKVIWERCPECREWCSAEKKGLMGRIGRLFTKEEDDLSESFAKWADYIGQKGLGRLAGKAFNYYANIWRIPGEAIDGDKYKFYCKCGYTWGTDDESTDQSEGYKLYKECMMLYDSYVSVGTKTKPEIEKYVNQITTLINQMDAFPYMFDFESMLYDLYASVQYFYLHNSDKAIEGINHSLDICPDDTNAIALRGVFRTVFQKPIEKYKKIQDIIKFKESKKESFFLSNLEFETELNNAAERYADVFLQIPKTERKFLVIDDELRYLPDSFLVLSRSMLDSLESVGLDFPNGYASEKALYICHPYKTNMYLDAENYKDELFYDQLNELIEVLQCLGAKQIEFTDIKTNETTIKKETDINAEIEGGKKGIGRGNINGTYNNVNEYYEIKKQELFHSRHFPLKPYEYPFVYEGSVWFKHISEWQSMSRIRLRGEEKYTIRLSSSKDNLIKENEQLKLKADFEYLLAKGNLEGAKTLNFERQEKSNHEWVINVEYYPLEEYHKNSNIVIQEDNILPNTIVSAKKRNIVTWIMGGIILILIIALLFVLL